MATDGKSVRRHDKNHVESPRHDFDSICQDHVFGVCQVIYNASPRSRSTSGDVECGDEQFERRPGNRDAERSGATESNSTDASIHSSDNEEDDIVQNEENPSSTPPTIESSWHGERLLMGNDVESPEIDRDFDDVCHAVDDDDSPRNTSTSGHVGCAGEQFECCPGNREVEKSGAPERYSTGASIYFSNNNKENDIVHSTAEQQSVKALVNHNGSNSPRPNQSNNLESMLNPPELVASSSEHSQTCRGGPTAEAVQGTRLASAVTTSKNRYCAVEDDDELQPGAYRVASRAHGALPAWARIHRDGDGDDDDNDDDLPPEMRRPRESNEDIPPEMRQQSYVSNDGDSEQNVSDENDPTLANPTVADPNVADQLVAAHLVDTEEERQRIQELEAQTEEEQQRIQELEAQNRMLREREQNVVEARVMKKSEILKSFFDLCDPEFRRQRLCAFGFIFLALAAIVLGVVLTKDRRIPAGPSTEAPTMPPTPEPTPEPTSADLGNLTVFLSEFASFNGGTTVVNQSTPQYQAAKWLADNNTHLDEYSETQIIQRYVLATLYFSTNGDNWTMNTNWLDDSDECRRWFQSYGWDLSCTSQNDTRRILLGGNGLKGSIPPELAFLSNSLEMIVVHGNKLTGTVPTELALLTGLTYLDVDDNALGGTLSTELGLLTKLNFLVMTDNAFSGTLPDELCFLTNLVTLRLGNNLTGPISTEIGSLASLGELILQKNYLNGTIPASVGLMTSLTMLELNSNDLSGIIPSEIAYLPSLRVLNLEGNRLTGTIPREFHKLKALRSLRLDSNMLSGTIPTSIGLMTALQKLHLDNNMNLTGPLPSEFGALTNLKELFLGNNSFTGTIPSEVGLMGALETFFLDENELTGTIPSEIGSMKNLIHLSLSRNMLNGTIPSSIHDLDRLEMLWLEENGIKGPFTCPTDVPDCKVSCEIDNETCRVL